MHSLGTLFDLRNKQIFATCLSIPIVASMKLSIVVWRSSRRAIRINQHSVHSYPLSTTECGSILSTRINDMHCIRVVQLLLTHGLFHKKWPLVLWATSNTMIYQTTDLQDSKQHKKRYVCNWNYYTMSISINFWIAKIFSKPLNVTVKVRNQFPNCISFQNKKKLNQNLILWLSMQIIKMILCL